MPKTDGRAQGNANLLKANCVRFAGQSRLRTALQPFSFWEYIACLMQKHREAFLCPDEKLLRSAFGQSAFFFNNVVEVRSFLFLSCLSFS